MSLESVRAFFAENAPDIAVIVTEQSSATVELAAQAHGVEPAQIAKTICLRVGETTMLVVAAGTARLDNRKFKPSGRRRLPLRAAGTVAGLLRRLFAAVPGSCAGRRRNQCGGQDRAGQNGRADRRGVGRRLPIGLRTPRLDAKPALS